MLLLTLVAVSFNSSAVFAADTVVYDDALATGWDDNFSWASTINLQSSNAYAGNRSTSVTITGAYGALHLNHDTTLNSADFSSIKFYMNGGDTGGQALRISVVTESGDWSTGVIISPVANSWTEHDIPFGSFGNPATISGFVFQDVSGSGAATFYLDEISLIEAGAVTPTPSPTPVTGAPQLRDLNLFETVPHGQWVGSGDGMTIDAPGSQLPVDYSQTLNGLPSYRFHASGYSGWWIALLAGSSWESYSLEPYHANGALEFSIKGAVGGEDVFIGLQDTVFERDPKHYQPTQVRLENYVNVTTEWQDVRIPLTHLVPTSALSVFDTTQISSLEISNYDTHLEGETRFWISNIRWTSPDGEPTYDPIKVNQLGYTTTQNKVALVSGFQSDLPVNVADVFYIRDVNTDVIMHTGNVALVSDYDEIASGERVFSADFSNFTTPGTYRIEMNGLTSSLPFTISDTVYDTLLVDSLRYFYLQRQGMALDAAYAGVFARGVGHPQETAAVFDSGLFPARDMSQGWYDAGDYGKYVNAAATGVAELLYAFEHFPTQFPDNHMNIPESGNSVPDIIDEIRWELDWMLKMQDPTSGGFYHMVKSDTDQDIRPDLSTAVRIIRDKDDAGYGSRTNIRPTVATGSAVGALAHASIVFEQFDATYAATLLQAAEDGWDYLAATPNLVLPPQGSFIPYNDTDDADDRFYAAAALYRATGSAEYSTYVANNYANIDTKLTDTNENAYGVGFMAIPGVLEYLAAENPDTATYNAMVSDFNTWRTTMVNRFNNSVWQTTLEDEDYYWGSNNPAMTTALGLTVGTKLLGTYDQDIIDLSRATLSYILGTNPLRFSYISGYTGDSLQKPFSLIYNFDNVPDVPRGILVGGPNRYNNALLYSRFSAKAYQDNAAAWSTNEHTVYWNSTLVFSAALAAEELDDPGLPPTPTNTPEPTATNTPLPTATNTPLPTATNTPLPTATNTPLPTATSTPLPTATSTLLPTATNTPMPTATNTPIPTPTSVPVSCPTNSNLVTLNIDSVNASGYQGNNTPNKSIDDQFDTRWTVLNSGEWLLLDLGSNQWISQADISFRDGDTLQYSFEMSVSSDSVNWTSIYDGLSSGNTSEFEPFLVGASGRYLRIDTNGNSSNDRTSIREIELCSNPNSVPNSIELGSAETHPNSSSLLMVVAAFVLLGGATLIGQTKWQNRNERQA